MTSSTVRSQTAATSRTVGQRPSCWRWSSLIRSTRAIASCMPRETWIVQVRSRKWRLSSPRIVGTAKEVNAIPRSGS